MEFARNCKGFEKGNSPVKENSSQDRDLWMQNQIRDLERCNLRATIAWCFVEVLIHCNNSNNSGSARTLGTAISSDTRPPKCEMLDTKCT